MHTGCTNNPPLPLSFDVPMPTSVHCTCRRQVVVNFLSMSGMLSRVALSTTAVKQSRHVSQSFGREASDLVKMRDIYPTRRYRFIQ